MHAQVCKVTVFDFGSESEKENRDGHSKLVYFLFVINIFCIICPFVILGWFVSLFWHWEDFKQVGALIALFFSDVVFWMVSDEMGPEGPHLT